MIVIIGNGIAGITAARHIRKLDSQVRITVISGETKHFFSRTALMYIYMGHMKFEHTKPYEDWFWQKNRIDLVMDQVTSVDFEASRVLLKQGSPLSYSKLIIATGSKPNRFGWPGQDLQGVQSLYSKQDLDLLEANTAADRTKQAVVVGGGLIGVELAEMLHARGISVTFLVREKNFWNPVLPEDDAKLIDHQIRLNHIDLRLETELKEIKSTGNQRVTSVMTNKGEEIPCQLVGLTVGVSPNVDFLKQTPLDLDRGILVDEYLQTNIEHVYAIGDCAQLKSPPPGRRPIEAVWYVGRMMGETVAHSICGRKRLYSPGHWYNSAKFFDLEYQTYGQVPANPSPDREHFFVKLAEDKAMHLVWHKESRVFEGINTYGIRLRHQMFERWLTQGQTIDYVLEHLKDANFDPECYKAYEHHIIDQFNAKFQTKLKPQRKSWRRILGLST